MLGGIRALTLQYGMFCPFVGYSDIFVIELAFISHASLTLTGGLHRKDPAFAAPIGKET